MMNANELNEFIRLSKKYRDSVFRSYFNDKVKLLSLCNAVLDTNYNNPDELIINNFEGVFLSNLKNDISCKIHDQYLVLIEHQTTINNNMPFRCLAYAVKILENEIENHQRIYREPLIKFPAPKFFVLYDGNKEEPLQRELRLSEAFGGDNSSLELVVKSFNINKRLNSPLLSKSKYLNEYSTFVGKVKEYLSEGVSLTRAFIKAVKYCLKNNIMKKFFETKGKEVFEMLALEWNLEDALNDKFQEGIERGIEQGIEKTAMKMLQKDMNIEIIHEITNLPIERIKIIAKNLHQ